MHRKTRIFPDRSILIVALLGAIALCVRPVCAQEQNWPQFRGRGSLGVLENGRLPERWTASENIAWKTELPGRGWSSPITWGSRIFVTSVVNKGVAEPPKKGLYFGGERPAPTSEHEWTLTCLDAKTGNIRWKKVAFAGVPKNSAHVKNSFASETPVTDGKHVFVYFSGLGVYCYDLDGRLAWTTKFPARKTRNGWGAAASPVLNGDRLFVVDDNEEASALIALDTWTGAEVWRVPRDEKSNWSTPFVWRNGGRTEIVTAGSGKVRSYSLDGKLLWWFTGMSSITIATPYEDKGLLFVTSGYVGDRSRPIYAIRPGAAGDITLKDGETKSDYISWSNPTAAPYNPSTLAYGGRLYVLYDRSLISCFDAATGKPYYEKERLPQGSGFTASPWASGGLVYCLSEDGITHVVRAGDRFELVRSNPLTDDDMCMATPALAGDQLLIRTAARLYCIRRAAQ